MQGQDQSEITTDWTEKSADEVEKVQPTKPTASGVQSARVREVDWLAIGVVLLIAGLFALAARLNPQPATSLAPAAVLSGTGWSFPGTFPVYGSHHLSQCSLRPQPGL